MLAKRSMRVAAHLLYYCLGSNQFDLIAFNTGNSECIPDASIQHIIDQPQDRRAGQIPDSRPKSDALKETGLAAPL